MKGAARLLAALALGAALAAHAQPPAPEAPPAPRDVSRTRGQESYSSDLITLSEVLGGAHYLRILCVGRGDQSWRSMMRRFMDLEGAPGAPQREAMVAAFNEGYRAEEERFPACSPEAQSEEQALKAKGARLASALAARYRD